MTLAMPELQKEYGNFIGGEWRPAKDGATFETHCPADGRLLASCAEATREDVDDAVNAAWAAWESWKNVAPAERAAILMKVADAIDANKEHLAMVESLDNGKPIRETLNVDVPMSADHFRYFAGAVRVEEGSAAMLDGNTLSLILREPIGVVGQVVPWNFPFLMAAWKLAPVLAAGCCTVFKPSSITPLSVLELARIVQGILPPGVFNVVTGKGSKAGQYILEHKGFRKLAFTGSTDVGRDVAKAAADRLIPSTLELGGKSANIYFPDCKWDMAMDGLQMGILFNQGQVCCAGSRVFVHEDIYDKFIEDAVKAFNKIKVGLPWDPATQMGSQINKHQVEHIQACVDAAVKEGAAIACGGTPATDGELANGAFYKPTLLTNVTNDMTVAQEEIFGPLLPILEFSDTDQVKNYLLTQEKPLALYYFTSDSEKARQLLTHTTSGGACINDVVMHVANPYIPFGGVGNSGMGYYHGKYSFYTFSHTRSVVKSSPCIDIRLKYPPYKTKLNWMKRLIK